MSEALARALWHGPLTDPEAPARALAAQQAAGAGYEVVLDALSVLVRHELPLGDTLTRALDAFPWSIDLALLALEAARDPSAALTELARRVTAQNRRRAALAWALWSHGEATAARAVLAAGDLASRPPAEAAPAEDRLAAAELAILCGAATALPAGPEGMRLSLLQTWRQHGAAALARRLDLEAVALPAHPPLWVWLVEVWVQERDLPRARAAQSRLAEHLGADHPEVLAQRIRLALDSEMPGAARALLDTLPDREAPWRWPARRHVQHLRCLSAEIAARPRPDYAPFLRQAEAAAHLHPRHGGLRALYWQARELTGDWDDLARALPEQEPDAVTAGALLGRLGLPEAGLALIADAPAANPDAANPDAAARRALRRAELHLRRGALDDAARALGPPPQAWPLRADHAWWAAEIALARRDTGAALAVLGPALAAHPTRMGLLLSAARAHFLTGESALAARYLDRFRALKTAQLATPPADDLRDLITRDALTGAADGPAAAARAFALRPPVFTPVAAPPIPRQITHYWEGPRSAPVERGLRAWAHHHPDLRQRVFDAPAAEAWLGAHTPALVPLFARLAQPATRADLFRLALIGAEGGLYADLDEYPRLPVSDWLEGARAVLVIEEGYGTIANNFLAALPGLPLFTRLLHRVTARLERVAQPYPWWDSGPAPLGVEALAARQDPDEAPGLRFVTQWEYDARVATNLPFPHKRGPTHWR